MQRASHPASVPILLLLGACLAVLRLAPAWAQAPLAREVPFLLQADEMRYDEKLGVVVASGNVEISQENRTLFADTVTYNRKEDLLTASGNVTLLEPTGEVMFAEYAEVTGDFKDGIVRNIRMLLAEEVRRPGFKAPPTRARLAGAGGRRTGGRIMELRKAVYSPCELCPEDRMRAPLWQVKAIRIIHDRETHDIEYADASIEVAGVPVAYLPYFSHPDPTVERRSGFLAPSFRKTSNLGFAFQLPYYMVIAPNIDATIDPIFMTQETPIFSGEYRHRFDRGKFEITGSVKGPNRAKAPEEDFRGHVFSRGRYDIDDTWRAGFDVARSTDDTYLGAFSIPTQYGFQVSELMTTRLFAEGFRRRTYAAANAFLYQDLRAEKDPSQSPLVFPIADYNFVGEPDRHGAHWTLDADLMNLYRPKGTDSRRLSLKGGWLLPYTAPAGDVYSLNATVQGDGYWSSGVVNEDNPGGATLNGVTGRVFPQLALDWRYPFARAEGPFTQLVEPVISVVAAKNGGNPSRIPNEDSLDFEFDDTNLFSASRFTGIDRVEGGQRVNYGLRMGVFGSRGGRSTAFIGHSYRFRKDDTFPQGSGVDDKFSDLVGRVEIEARRIGDLLYRFRLNKDDFAPLRNELDAHVGPRALNVSLNYLFIDAAAGTGGGEFGDREEISGRIASQVTEYWGIDASARRNLVTDGGFINYGFGLTYEDECTTARLDFTRSFTEDREIEPTDAVVLHVVLKTLGEYQTAPL